MTAHRLVHLALTGEGEKAESLDVFGVQVESKTAGAGLAGLFVWVLPTRADRDLFFQDSCVLLAWGLRPQLTLALVRFALEIDRWERLSRFCEVVALQEVAADVGENVAFLRALDAFGDHE